MVAKNGWHTYETKLCHCHPMCKSLCLFPSYSWPSGCVTTDQLRAVCTELHFEYVQYTAVNVWHFLNLYNLILVQSQNMLWEECYKATALHWTQHISVNSVCRTAPITVLSSNPNWSPKPTNPGKYFRKIYYHKRLTVNSTQQRTTDAGVWHL